VFSIRAARAKAGEASDAFFAASPAKLMARPKPLTTKAAGNPGANIAFDFSELGEFTNSIIVTIDAQHSK